MSLFWGVPLAFAGLALLLIPLLLHLERRRTPRTLRFAALQWIARAVPARRSLRLGEWLLLLMRLLLLALLVLWLASPMLLGTWRAPQRVLALWPGLDAATVGERASFDRSVWLAPGFPPLDTPPPAQGVATSSLLRELDAALDPDDRLVVRLPEVIDGLDAQSIAVSRSIEWQVVPDRASTSPHSAPSPRRIAVRWSPEADAEALRLLRAAIDAWSAAPAFAVVRDEAPLGTALPDDSDVIVQVGGATDAAIVAQVRRGATLLRVAPVDASSDDASQSDPAWPPAARRHGRGRILHFSGAFTPQRVPLHEPDFPTQLFALLFESPAPTRAAARAVVPTQDATLGFEPQTPLRPWLAWAIALLFLCERLLASARRSEARA